MEWGQDVASPVCPSVVPDRDDNSSSSNKDVVKSETFGILHCHMGSSMVDWNLKFYKETYKMPEVVLRMAQYRERCAGLRQVRLIFTSIPCA